MSATNQPSIIGRPSRRQPVETSPDLKRTSVLKDDLNFEREVEFAFFFFLIHMRMTIQNYTVSLEIEVPNRASTEDV